MNRNDALLREGYDKAIEILHINSTKIGFSASIENFKNYYSVWARDHSICTIAACLTNNKKLIQTAKNGIFNLLDEQIDHGQVPSYIEIGNKKTIFGGYGAITSYDSNMWVLLATSKLFKKLRSDDFLDHERMVCYTKIYRLLRAFDSNNNGLIEVPIASDWADVFNRTYHVLYDQCLYYQTLNELLILFQEDRKRLKTERLYKKIDKYSEWLKKRKNLVKKIINKTFWFTKNNIDTFRYDYMIIDKMEKRDYNYYQSHLVPFRIEWHRRFDAFGNILAIVTGIANKERSEKIIKHVLKHRINEPFPLKCLYPPVHKKDKDWEPVYKYKQKAYHYHNGGIWPIITGFWVYALRKNGKKKLAKKELIKLAKILKENNWNFNEYHHGKTGKAMGIKYQAWSAAGFIIGYHAITEKKIDLF